ncbi:PLASMODESMATA CALLOSE-BINDING PROTEIN 3-like [Cucurbita pepo subsp. pepo]|uniref:PLASMODESMATA CALLOSE-BINDING PROTEIN 3-like n=1 Tax=Cucurbita moschata TaxID=3662 RepID=A0A6J1H812_CUCMO|nr:PLASMODESMATA CALLOSE-BINDING PROTEIN 3-like [Cucurbita moschata]XP_023548894.1 PLASMODESMATA CALLOSE-BINDING PROTEIN 3-like [Cucurbita pepo subsp. pepo]
MATLVLSHSFLLLLLLFLLPTSAVDGAYWCVARSEASYEALQTALDYACATGADCTPLLSNGLCFLPNTIQAHASYAFNSFFQRKAMAPGSCDFAGSATIAQTDPSYGSCVYPSSISAAGGAITPSPPANTSPTPTITVPATTTTPSFNNGNTGDMNGLDPVYNPASTSTPTNSKASSSFRIPKLLFSIAISLASLTL